MDPRVRPPTPRQFDEFVPETRVVSDEGAETLLVYLPEFKKEQLRVQLTPSRLLRISGQRPVGGNKWVRFMKEAHVPQYCDAKDIAAKFEGGVLSIRQPKLITPAEPQETGKPTVEPPKSQPSETQPAPAPSTAIPAAPVAAPSYEHQMVNAKEQNKKEEEGEGAQKKWEDAKKCIDEQAKESREEVEGDTRKKWEEERQDKGEIKAKPGVGGGIFKQLNKPENLKMVGVIVVVAMALALYVAYMNRVCRRYIAQEDL